MRRFFHHRLVRALATCLLLAQVNLLWIAGLHHHESPAPPTPGAAKLLAGASHEQPASESALLCPVCQIVRQSAARPATGTPPPEAVASAPLHRVVSLASLHSHRSTLLPSRAPPLA